MKEQKAETKGFDNVHEKGKQGSGAGAVEQSCCKYLQTYTPPLPGQRDLNGEKQTLMDFSGSAGRRAGGR